MTEQEIKKTWPKEYKDYEVLTPGFKFAQSDEEYIIAAILPVVRKQTDLEAENLFKKPQFLLDLSDIKLNSDLKLVVLIGLLKTYRKLFREENGDLIIGNLSGDLTTRADRGIKGFRQLVCVGSETSGFPQKES